MAMRRMRWGYMGGDDAESSSVHTVDRFEASLDDGNNVLARKLVVPAHELTRQAGGVASAVASLDAATASPRPQMVEQGTSMKASETTVTGINTVADTRGQSTNTEASKTTETGVNTVAGNIRIDVEAVKKDSTDDIEVMRRWRQKKLSPENVQGQQTELPVADAAHRVYARQILASIRRMLDPPEPG